MAGPGGLGKHFNTHRVAFRIAGLTLLLSAVFAVLATGVELVTDYNRDVAQIEQRLSDIRKTDLPSVVASVWAFDEHQLQVQLQGIEQLPDIAYVQLTDPYGHDYTFGQMPPEGEQIIQVFPLIRDASDPEDLGRLRVVGSTAGVYARLTQRAYVILMTQSLKAVLLALVILLLFRQLVTRHLETMARYGRNFDPDRPKKPLVLNRKRRGGGRRDELDEVVEAVNGMRESLEFRIDAQRQVERALRAERNQMSTILATTGALVVMFDRQARIVRFNKACEQTSGRSESAVLGATLDDAGLIPDEDIERAEAVFRSVINGGPPTRYQGYWLSRDGERRMVVWSVTALRGDSGEITHCLATGIDITDLQDAKSRIYFLTNYDPVTGLPNRLLLADRLEQAFGRVDAMGQVVGVMVFTLDRFDAIADAYGPVAAEELLRQMANALNKGFDTETVLARLGDDTLAMMAVRDLPEEMATVAAEAAELMSRGYRVRGQELNLQAYVGVAIYPDDGVNSHALMGAAESALRAALASKSRAYRFHGPEFNRRATHILELESDLRHAVERGQLSLHYQPQVDLLTGRVDGVEALVRWHHPKRGMVRPDEFIGLAEETGLIFPIGEWVMRTACEQAAAWQKAGLAPLTMAVNLSGRQFMLPDIAATTESILEATGLDPHWLELELTETVAMTDAEAAVTTMEQLKAIGVSLAIDDFGTGYSSLGYLRRLPVDKLKVDRMFVNQLTRDPGELAIARTILAMARTLGLRVIAEGVETLGQLALLAEHGCDAMQGYYFSRPLDAEACTRLLEERAGIPPDAFDRGDGEHRVVVFDPGGHGYERVEEELRDPLFQLHEARTRSDAFELLARREAGVLIYCPRPDAVGRDFLMRVGELHPRLARLLWLESEPEGELEGVADIVARASGGSERLQDVVRRALALYTERRGAPGPVSAPRTAGSSPG